MRRGGAADGDVNFLKFPRPIVELHGASAELFGQRHRAVMGTVGDNDAARAA